jgi:hypothetical protein
VCSFVGSMLVSDEIFDRNVRGDFNPHVVRTSSTARILLQPVEFDELNLKQDRGPGNGGETLCSVPLRLRPSNPVGRSVSVILN